MYISDSHIHTSWSHDGKYSMEEIALAAIEKKVDMICFTDHYELVPDTIEEINYTDYIKEFEIIKDKYKSQIEIRLGSEMGIQIDKPQMFSAKVNEHPFDYILAATHRVNYIGAGWPEFFEGLTKLQGYEKYYKFMLESVKKFDDFDCWAHLDYIIRYGNFADKGFEYHEMADFLDEILKTIIAKGKGIEVNTSFRRDDPYIFHPNTDILLKYKELGGEIICLGSDSHDKIHIAHHASEACSYLKTLGFNYVTTFKQRKPEFIKL